MISLKNERVLVTGGAGFIGSHLVDLLRAERAADVVVLDNLDPQTHPAGRPAWVPSDVEFIQGDVRSPEDLGRALTGVRYVFHLAGYGGFVPEVSKYMDVNATGTIRLYEALRKRPDQIRKVVVASSQGIYGEGRYASTNSEPCLVPMRAIADLEQGKWEHRDRAGNLLIPQPTPESQPHNSLNVYSISKYAEERAALALGYHYNVPTCCLRFGLTYGPRQSLHNPYTGVVAIFTTEILHDRPPLPYEDGQQTRDFTFVVDTVRATLYVMEHEGSQGQVYNVGTGVGSSVDKLARCLATVYDNPAVTPAYRNCYRPSDIRHLVLEPSKLADLGYRCQTPLEEGLKHVAKWVLAQGDVPDLFRGAEAQLIHAGVVRQARVPR